MTAPGDEEAAKFVFDTSAYLNGWRDHYPPPTFSGVWDLVGSALEDGRIVLPREVLREITAQDDDVQRFIEQHAEIAVDPSPEAQAVAGKIYAKLPKPGVRDKADPFVVAEAKVRGLTVITYEGRSFSGIPTRNWAKTMPGICKQFEVPCRTLPEAITALGGAFQ